MLAAYWFPFTLTLVLMLGCFWASLHREAREVTMQGRTVTVHDSTPTLGLFIGGLVVATVVTPGMVVAERKWLGRVVAWAGVVDAIILVWLGAVVSGVISVGDWGEAVVVLVAYAGAVAGVGLGLAWVRVPAVFAAAITVVVGLGWLSWPVWMAPWLTGENREAVVAWLVWGHPVFAMDRAMIEAFGVPWAQMPIAYRLTNIGDDIGYEVPRSVWACVVVHAAIAVFTIAPQVVSGRWKNNRSAEADPTGRVEPRG
jgi:hypothetical protein